jgi:hypothetical protein
LIARQHALRPRDEGHEQVELAARDVDDRTRRRAQNAAGRLQTPSIELVGKRQIVAVRSDLGRTAQHSLDSRDQLARTERLHDIIVRANLEADDAVDLRAHSGQHDDRRPILLAQLLAEHKPAFAGHHEIEDNEVEPADLDRLHHLAPVGRLGDPEAMFGKILAHECAKLAIVIDNQDVTGGACAQEYAPDQTNSGRN